MELSYYFFSLTCCCEKYDNKKYLLLFFLCCLHSKGHPRSKNWTLDFEPAFLSGPEPTIDFSNWSAVSHSKTRDFRFSGHFRFRTCDFRSLPVPVM